MRGAVLILLAAAVVGDASAGIRRPYDWLKRPKIDPADFAAAREALAEPLRGCEVATPRSCYRIVADHIPDRTQQIAFARDYWAVTARATPTSTFTSASPPFAMFLAEIATPVSDVNHPEMVHMAAAGLAAADPDAPAYGRALYHLALSTRPVPRFTLDNFLALVEGPAPPPHQRQPSKFYSDHQWVERAGAFWAGRKAPSDVDVAEIDVVRGDLEMQSLRLESAVVAYRRALALRAAEGQTGERLWSTKAKLIEALIGMNDLDGALAVPVPSRLESEVRVTGRSDTVEVALMDIASLRAEALLRKGKLPEAESLLRAVIERKAQTKSFGLYRDITTLAEILAERGNLAEANLLLATASPELPDFHASTVFRAARIFLAQGRRAEAKKWLVASTLSPGYYPWEYGGSARGIAMLARMHREDATKDSADALRRVLGEIASTPYAQHPDTAELITELGKQLASRNPSEARALLIRARVIWTATYPEHAERWIDANANLADQLSGTSADLAFARTLYRSAGAGVLARLSLASGFDKATQAELVRYRPVFAGQVRTAWALANPTAAN